MLKQVDIEQIDSAARGLLEDPGILVEDDDILQLLIKNGARPGSRAGVARIGTPMLREYLDQAPETARFADRNGGMAHVTPTSEPCFWTGAALFYLDRHGLRETRMQDLADFSRIVDSLANVDAIVGTSIEDAAPKHRDFVGFRIMAANTHKHIRALSFTPRGGQAMIEMAEVLAGGQPLKSRPLFSVGFTAHGPLRWTGLALGVYKATAGYGIPCTVNGEPMAGASAPVTLAGTAAIGTAEILSGIVINQLLEPGRPCLFNLGFAHVMDMRKGFAVTGGPENALLAAAGAGLARFYNLPSVSWMCTDSLYYDAQNALEKSVAATTHAQAGVSVIWGAGQVESEKTISPVQAVIDDEIIGMLRRYLKGFQVNEETLAVDLVRDVGICGSFLDSDHTLRHFRSELFEPTVLVREQRTGAPQPDTLVARSEARVDAILNRQPEPVLGDRELEELLRIERAFME